MKNKNVVVLLPKKATMEEARLQVLTAFSWLKRSARRLSRSCRRLTDEASRLDRERRIMVRRENPFDAHRIEALKKRASALRESVDQIKGNLAEAGQLFITIAHAANGALTFHDKCQVCGISHTAAIRNMDGKDSVTLEKMVFVHCLEFRGEREFLEPFDEGSPIWTIYWCRIVQEMQTNSRLQEAGRKIFDELFGDLPRYQRHIAADGTETFSRMPPRLRVVEKEVRA